MELYGFGASWERRRAPQAPRIRGNVLNQRNSRLQNCKLSAPCVFGLSEQLRGFEVSGSKLRPAPGTLVTLDLVFATTN